MSCSFTRGTFKISIQANIGGSFEGTSECIFIGGNSPSILSLYSGFHRMKTLDETFKSAAEPGVWRPRSCVSDHTKRPAVTIMWCGQVANGSQPKWQGSRGHWTRLRAMSCTWSTKRAKGMIKSYIFRVKKRRMTFKRIQIMLKTASDPYKWGLFVIDEMRRLMINRNAWY